MAEAASLTLRLLGDSAHLRKDLDRARTGVSRFTKSVKDDVNALKGAFNSVTGRLAGIGLGLSFAQQLGASAKLDQSLTQVKLTAGATQAQMLGLRKELFALSKQSGQPVEELQKGFSNLIAGGQSWDEALATMKGVNVAMGVTKASADVLTSGLTVAATAFDFDLSKPGKALELLEKMTVSGRKGNAELEALSGVFSRIGVNAKSANLSYEGTLAFVEALSLIEKNPERLSTLADSTLRLFTNAKYGKAAQKATGVKFFDEKDARRDVESVLGDLRAKYATLTTDLQRSNFIEKAFGNTDLDTKKGLQTLLSGNTLDKMQAFRAAIDGAPGTLTRELPEAVSNAVDQAERLKTVLREAADGFTGRLNKAFTGGVKKLIDSKEDGGLGLSGGQILGGAAAATAASVILGRRAKGLAGKLLGGVGSTAAGVAQGKALEEMAGVTPVFVTNWPGTAGFSLPGAPGGRWEEHLKLPGKGAASKAISLGLMGTAAAGAALLAAGAIGGAVSSYRNASTGTPSSLMQMQSMGSRQIWSDPRETRLQELAEDAAAASDVHNQVNITLQVDQSGKLIAESSDPKTKLKVSNLRRGVFNYSGMGQ